MSRVADRGNDPFKNGHNAAAVMASTFYCREQQIGEEAQKEILRFMEHKLLRSRIYQPRRDEEADVNLITGLVDDLEAGVGQLRRSGHNIIFAVLSLQALREVPEAVTPERITGLRAMIQSFGKAKGNETASAPGEGMVDMQDEKKFIHALFEEYLDILELYLNGRGHHGYAGHVLTVGHALVNLHRLGYAKVAKKGVPAYWDFLREARKGANRGGKRVQDGPKRAPTPRDAAYWKQRVERRSRELTSSHLIKYPYSFYALAKDLEDPELKARIMENLYHLSAVS